VPRNARPIKFFSPNIILNRKRRIIISKEKKEKKRKPSYQVEGFKKASFFEKILPYISSEAVAYNQN
jgi:hypothetical protein